MKFNKKKIWLDKLYYDIGKQQYDFWLCGTYKKNDEIRFTKWKKYSECIFPIDIDGITEYWKNKSFFQQINQRQILPIEIVLDIENKTQLPEIVKKLNELKYSFYIFTTGSRGYHIHIFFDRIITDYQRIEICKYFKTDTQINSKHLIALEFAKHWKSGELKLEVDEYGNPKK